MLHTLRIQNYAIIDELSISFSGNLNIITGETGAGKSILMGALDLILGKRADTAVLKNKAAKCIVEARFVLKSNEFLQDFFAANDLDPDEEILVRREIAATGKSRSFINDTPVSLAQLKELSGFLADLHRQFDTQEISTEDFQRAVLDALAGNATLLSRLKAAYTKYSLVRKEADALLLEQANAEKEADYNRFLAVEFSAVNLKENELEDLDTEIRLLSNAEQVKQQLNAVYGELSEGEQPIVQTIKSLAQKLSPLLQYREDLEDLQKRLLSAQVEILDVADELERIDNGISYDAERINTVNERIAAGYRLLKKHSVHTTAELLAIQETLQVKLDAIVNIRHEIETKTGQAAGYLDECTAIAKKISDNRKAAIKPFTQKVNALLAQVGMPNALIKVEMNATALSGTGSDEINFLFDANKSSRFEPLHKVASGGELSRLMLSVKSLVAKELALPVLIFDEIDTGISGEAARQVGIIMKELSASHQLIAITHQPQIAAKADAHYFVFKEIVGDTIQTSVRLLNGDERITAIANMLSGERPTAAALANAKEMMN